MRAPSTTTWPAWILSSTLMQRSRVDLPEPDGPRIVHTSPYSTFKLTPASTWMSPKNLWTSRTSTM